MSWLSCFCCGNDSGTVYKADGSHVEVQRKKGSDDKDKQTVPLSVNVDDTCKLYAAPSQAFSMSSSSATVSPAKSPCTYGTTPTSLGSPAGSSRTDRTQDLMEHFAKLGLINSATSSPLVHKPKENVLHQSTDECAVVLEGDKEERFSFPFAITEVIAQYAASENVEENVAFQSYVTKKKTQTDTFLGLVRVNTNALVMDGVKNSTVRGALFSVVEKYFSHINSLSIDVSNFSPQEFFLLPTLSRLKSLRLYPADNIKPKLLPRMLAACRNQAEVLRFPQLETLTLGNHQVMSSENKEEAEEYAQTVIVKETAQKIFDICTALKCISFNAQIHYRDTPASPFYSFKRHPAFFVRSSCDDMANTSQGGKAEAKGHRRLNTYNGSSVFAQLMDENASFSNSEEDDEQ